MRVAATMSFIAATTEALLSSTLPATTVPADSTIPTDTAATDTTAAAKLLQSLTPENATKQANTKYQKYTLHYADTHLLAEHLFGESLSKHFTASYYTIINNFVLIGGSAEHLQVLIEKHLAKQTLTKADLQTGNSLGNAILYINQKLMNEWLRGVSGAKFNEDLGSRLAAAQNLHPLVV